MNIHNIHIVCTRDECLKLVAALVNYRGWFTVEPWLDGNYEITTQAENRSLVEVVVPGKLEGQCI